MGKIHLKSLLSFLFVCMLFVNVSAGYDEQIDFNNALFMAVESGDLQGVKDAISNGANVNAEDIDLFTPLHHAAMNGYIEIAEHLIIKGAFVDAWYDEYPSGFKTPLHYAAENGHIDVVELFLKKGAWVNAEHLGWIPLHSATLSGHLDIAKLLIAEGANVDASDNEGYTPLYLAVQNGDLDIVTFLLEREAQVNTNLHITGNSPLHEAVVKQDTTIVKLLLEHGADIEAKNALGETPIEVAGVLGNSEIVELVDRYKETEEPVSAIEVSSGTVWFVHGDEKFEIGVLATSDGFPFGLAPTYIFSPDSSYLTYVGETAYGPDIFLVSQEGDVMWITENGAIDSRTSIAWSSDGLKFAFNMNENIWFYDMDREKLIRLTNPEDDEDILPSFKEDDKKVKFFRGGRFDFSFSGKEYEVMVNGLHCREVVDGEVILGERLD